MKAFKFLFQFSCYLIISCPLFSQAPSIIWQKALGGTGSESPQCIEVSSTGFSYSIGSTASNNGDVSGNHGSADVWLVKLDAAGTIIWKKCYGGTAYDVAYQIKQTTDGHLLAVGQSSSHNGDITSYYGASDLWVMKIDTAGTLIWQKTYGGTMNETAYDFIETSDSGFLVVGSTQSINGNVSSGNGAHDFWVIKIDLAGNLQWEETYGGSLSDIIIDVEQTLDNGYILAGYSQSGDGDVNGAHGDEDGWIVKIDSAGVIEWKRALGGSVHDRIYDLIQINATDGYFAVGETYSTDGDVTFNHGSMDAWLVKLDTDGTIEWQKTYGGSNVEFFYSILRAPDNNYVLTGFWNSTDGDIASGFHGNGDAWLVKISSDSVLLWQKYLGGTQGELAYNCKLDAQGNYYVECYAQSNNGDVTGNHGGQDFWVVKLQNELSTSYIDLPKEKLTEVFPNPSNGLISFRNIEKKSIIKIYDMSGRLIYQNTSDDANQTIDLSDERKGIYLYEVISSEKMYRGKNVLE